MTADAAHLWLCGARRTTREHVLAAMSLDPAWLPTVDAHRRLRGPYTAGGAILRAIVPRLLAERADLVHAHDIEVLSIAPELRQIVPATRETLTSLAIPEERTRFYARGRTMRIANGVAELIRDALAAESPSTLVIENAEHADHTDAELIAVLLRRIDPARLRLVVCAGADQGFEVLRNAVRRYARAVDLGSRDVAADGAAADAPGGGPGALAARYVAEDCVSDDPLLRAAYESVDDGARAALHDARAAELEATGELSWTLGAVPYHREHGSDASGLGAAALRSALDYCIDMGFYEATVDLGERGLAVIGHAPDNEHWWPFTTKMTTSLAALGRAEEAEQLYEDARAVTTNPQIHMQAAYATAMLYTRHHDESKKNHRLAKAWINEAIAIAGLLPEPEQRAFHSAFARNGLALIEVHLGNPHEALRLVDECLAGLDAELEPDKHRLHRSVLRYNRAQVYAGLGRLDEATADYDAVITDDPNYAEYYFDRANLQRRRGRIADALQDYEQAMRLSPPFPEVRYNRADLRLAQGDLEGGLAGLDDVLEIDPDFVEALINRAGVLSGLGRVEEARRDVDAGLRLEPSNPHLLCVLGQLDAADGAVDAARAAFDAALAADGSLVPAWAGRASLAYEAGDPDRAVADLTRALEFGQDPALLFNRAVAFQAAGRFAEALRDLDRAQELDPEDAEIRGARRECLAGRSAVS